MESNMKNASTKHTDQIKITSGFVLICLVVIFFTSCVSTNKGFQSSPVISRNIQLDPIKADIKVNETTKLNGSSSSTYIFFFRIKGDHTVADGINYSTEASGSFLSQFNLIKILRNNRLNKVRSAAAYKALSAGDYDFLVHPNYSMTKRNYLGVVKVYECSVTGYGAKYQNFRTEKQKIVILEDGKEIILQDK